MIKIFPRNVLRFIVLVLLQVLVFNNIQINGYINPYIYVLFILLLPFETPGWLILLVSFALGFSIDLFAGTIGIHTSATLFMGFVRPLILTLLSPRDGYDPGTFPRVHYYGPLWFLKYAAILVFTHHLFLFYIEVFRFADFFHTLFRVVLSTLFTLLIVFLSQYVIYRK